MNLSLAHGTYTAYAQGCRCNACRQYQNDRVARSRANRVVKVHGIRSSYDAGCRCEACKGARREAYRTLASEHPQKTAAAMARARSERGAA